MPVNINQPANKISLTNVSLVRLRKGKKRYELACYKNKLLEYRQGLESDLDNVLQVPTVFLSVSRGATAPREDLQKSFGKEASKEKIIEEILRKGEIQVGAGERRELLERLEREVVEIVQGRLVDPGTKRVYSLGMIRKALEKLSAQAGQQSSSAEKDYHPKGQGQGQALSDKMAKLDINSKKSGAKSKTSSSAAASGTATPTTEPDTSEDPQTQSHQPANKDATSKPKHLPTWTGVVATRSAKSQALDAMKALIAWQPISVMRARMRLRVTCPTSVAKMAAKAKAPGASAATAEEDGEGVEDGGVGGKGSAAAAAGGGGGGGGGSIKDRILSYVEQVETQDVLGEEWEVIGFVEPGAFKGLGEFVAGETKGRGRVEVLEMAVTHED